MPNSCLLPFQGLTLFTQDCLVLKKIAEFSIPISMLLVVISIYCMHKVLNSMAMMLARVLQTRSSLDKTSLSY